MPKLPNPNRIKVPAFKKGAGRGMEVEDGRWWALAEEKDRGSAAWETVTMLNQAHAPRHMDDALMIGLYENRLPYWAGKTNPLLRFTIEQNGRRVPLNLVKSVIDTAAAMLAKNDAELRAFTSGGSWREQRKAKQITTYNSGGFYLNQFRRHQKRAFIDGCLTRGRGAVKFWGDRKAGMVRCARAHPRTLLWNELEGDDPNNIYQWYPVARETLLRRFPDKAKIIAKCKASVNPVNPAYRRATALFSHADMIDVAECWHKGYRNEDDSGRHILRVEAGTLSDGPWPFEFFPFATYSWDDADEGWGGKPLADIISGFQTEITRHIRIYRKALERAAASAGAWLQATAGDLEQVQGENNTGETWTPRTYKGEKPVFAAPPALGPDFFQYIVWQYDKAFAEAGFNMLQAQGTKPEGVDAAVALRELNDIASTRQVPKGQRYEFMTEDAGRIQMALSKQLFTGGDVTSIKVRAPGTKFLREADFKDIADVEEDAYVLKQSATSALPTHFVGRMQAVTEMIRSGLFPQKQVEGGLGLRLLQMPDLEKEIDLETSRRELTRMQVDEALYEGKYYPPEPYQGLQGLIDEAQNQFMFAKTLTGVPKKNMRYLERIIAEASAMLKRLPAPQTAGPAADALQPGANPQAMLSPTPAPAQQVISEQPAVPLPMPGQLPVPAVPTTAPALA